MILELLILSKLYSKDKQQNNTVINKFPQMCIEVDTYWTRYENNTARLIPQKSKVNIFEIANIKDNIIYLENGEIVPTENTQNEIEELIKERTRYITP